MSQINSAVPTHPSLADSIREWAPATVLVRIFPAHRASVYLFESDFYRISLERRAERESAGLVRRYFGDAADWRVAHDFYLPTGGLYLTPDPRQSGYIPEDDQTFGLAPARLIAISRGAANE